MSRRRRPVVSVASDSTELQQALGVMMGITMATDRRSSDIVRLAHAEMARAFDDELAAATMSNQSAFWHVFEWDGSSPAVSQPLYRQMLYGRGKQMEATYEWKLSKRPIPTPEERKASSMFAGDPINNVPDWMINKLSGKSYVFRNKAAVMEYNFPTVVRPRKKNGRLMVPNATGFSMEMQTPMNFNYKFPQQNMGGHGSGTAGNFTRFWLGWWSSRPNDVFEKTVRHVVDNDIEEAGRMIQRTTRTRKKTVGFNVPSGSGEREFYKAARMSNEWLGKRFQSRAQAAAGAQNGGRKDWARDMGF